ncbi:helix-turn-helix domain-containing protein [Macrococcus equi]|uniref:helix-turn-helix domain-containing protein n=1 Tax=Macrococcus equi TaxID=3395462 RepID=UPI0039BDCDF7
MKLIGQILRSKRESLGMTLIDLERKIKIQKKYIEMIEKNEFENLPNPDYTRGFIEKYAKAVNLNAEQLITEHQEELPIRKLSAQEASKKIKSDHPINHYDSGTQKLLLWIIGIITVLFLLWLIFSQFIITDRNSEWHAEDINKSRNVTVEKKNDEKVITSKEDKSKKETQQKKNDEKLIEPLKLTYKNFDGSNLAYEVETQDKITLIVDSKIPTWVQVFDNKKKNYAYKEMKQETMQIDKDVESITLISGNSTSLSVYINDKKVTVPKEAENLITRTYFFKVIK